MIKTILTNGLGKKFFAQVYSNGAVKVSHADVSSFERSISELTRNKVLTELFSDSSGSTDLNVDGSAVTQIFSIDSEVGKIKYICSLRLIFNDTFMKIDNSESRRFGSAATSPGLTNGLTLTVSQGGIITEVFTSPVKAIGDFYRYAGGQGTPSAGIVNDEGSIGPNIDFLMAAIEFPKPVVLPAGVIDNISIKVQDDLTSIDLFEVIASGFQENI